MESRNLRDEIAAARMSDGEMMPLLSMKGEQILPMGVVGMLVIVGLFASGLEYASKHLGLGSTEYSALAALSAAATAVLTLAATIVAAAYVALTYLLWRQSAEQTLLQRKASEAAFMQQLMVEYDGLREHVQTVYEFYKRHDSLALAHEAFKGLRVPTGDSDYGYYLDDARIQISRFFVRIRKLTREGYLERRLIAVALGRAAIEDVFLNRIDPLDQVITVERIGKPSTIDRDFFRGLLTEFNLRDPSLSEVVSSRMGKSGGAAEHSAAV